MEVEITNTLKYSSDEFNKGVKVPMAAQHFCRIKGRIPSGKYEKKKKICYFKESHFDLSDSPSSGR